MRSWFLVGWLALSACALGAHAVASSEAHRLVSEGATLVDVRTPAEFAEGHLEGAINLPLADLASHVDELRSAKAVVLYCHSGLRAARAAAVLEQAGLKSVANLGPMSAW